GVDAVGPGRRGAGVRCRHPGAVALEGHPLEGSRGCPASPRGTRARGENMRRCFVFHRDTSTVQPRRRRSGWVLVVGAVLAGAVAATLVAVTPAGHRHPEPGETITTTD